MTTTHVSVKNLDLVTAKSTLCTMLTIDTSNICHLNVCNLQTTTLGFFKLGRSTDKSGSLLQVIIRKKFNFNLFSIIQGVFLTGPP